MTDIAAVKENRSIYSETGKTSPLSALPTSSPAHLKKETQETKAMTTDKDLNIPSSLTEKSLKPDSNSKQDSGDTLGSRSKSIVSDESSDLSELDSEAETEKMYNGEESTLKKIARHDNTEDSTMQLDNETENDTFIKDEIIDELRSQKNDSDLDEESNEDISKVVKELNEESQRSSRSNSESRSKRKLNDDSEEAVKRRKTDDKTEEKEEEEEEEEDKNQENSEHNSKTDEKLEQNKKHDLGAMDEEVIEGNDKGSILKDSTKEDGQNANGHKENQFINGVHDALVEASGEGEGEGEDEDEGEDEEEEEPEEFEQEELTEEQKIQKQKELEIEIQKQKERKEAIEYLTEIEVDFAKLRDRLYEDKMARYKSEIEMCLNGSHPELQTIYSKIDSVRNDKVRLAELSRKYKLECIDRKTRAQRTAIHQQYFKRIFDVKNNFLRRITEDWYKINKERRQMDSLLPDYSYRIPEYTDELVSQRQQVNAEISLLTGLNEYYGFPKAPELKAVTDDDLEADLKAMNIPA